MARSRSHSPARHLVLLALAIVGAAQKYTLNSFDPLSSNTIPAACRAAYAAPLEGCRRSDFVDGRVCSEACVRSVDEMEASIQTNCGGVLLPIDTLLAQALLGNLRELLCPGARDPPQQQPTPQPTVIQPPPQSTPTPSRSTRRPSSAPGNSPTPSPQLSTIIPNQPTTTRSSLTTVIVTEIVPPSSTTVPVIFTPTPVPAPTVATPPNPPNNNPPPAGNNGGGGGGSGPGGNDILNPLPSASWTLLPRLDLTVAAAVLSYLIL